MGRAPSSRPGRKPGDSLLAFPRKLHSAASGRLRRLTHKRQLKRRRRRRYRELNHEGLEERIVLACTLQAVADEYSVDLGGTLTADGQNGNPDGVLLRGVDTISGNCGQLQVIHETATGPSYERTPGDGIQWDSQAGTFVYDAPLSMPPGNVDSFWYHLQAIDMTTFQPVTSNSAQVTISLNGGGGTNTKPTADPKSVTVNEGGSIVIGLSGSDPDPLDCELTFSIFSSPSNGSLGSISNQTCQQGSPNIDTAQVTYTHNGSETISDSFQYRVFDGEDYSDPATVTITVNPVNDPPTAISDNYTVQGNTFLDMPAPGVLGNDTDPENDPLSAALYDDVDHGVLFLQSNGAFTYFPDIGYQGPDSFQYRAYDGQAFSNVATVSITVTAPSQPQANPDSYWTFKNVDMIVNPDGVLDNDIDPEGESLDAVQQTSPTNGTLFEGLNLDGSFSYRPNTNFVGTDQFTYTAVDESTSSDPATVTISVIEPFSDADNPDAENLGNGIAAIVYGDGYLGILFDDCICPAGADEDNLTADGRPRPSNIRSVSPVVSVDTGIPSDSPEVPSSIDSVLKINGVVESTTTWSTAGLLQGTPFRVAHKFDASAMSSGRYNYELTITGHYTNGSSSRTFTGGVNVVNPPDNGMGDGWMIQGLGRMIIQPGEGALINWGDGLPRWYAEDGSGGFERAPGDFSTLSFDSQNNIYTLAEPDGDRYEFTINDPQGNPNLAVLTKHIDLNNNETEYSYVLTDLDRIETITGPFGRTVTFQYAQGTGKLISITDYAGRVTDIVYAPDEVRILDPDPDDAGPLPRPETIYAYNPDGFIEQVTFPDDTGVKYTYNFADRVEQIDVLNTDQSVNGTISFDATEMQGLPDLVALGGAPATLLAAANLINAVGTYTDPLGNAYQFKTDHLGNLTEWITPPTPISAGGAKTVYNRDADGLLGSVVFPDPDGGANTPTITYNLYDALGNLKEMTLQDGTSKLKWTYEPGLDWIKSFTDELNRTVDYDYTFDPGDGHLVVALTKSLPI